MNPYESPAVVTHATERISYWRMAMAVVCFLPGLFLVLLALYGVSNHHSRGWPYPIGLTSAILVALGMYLLGAIGFACVGLGILRRKGKLQVLGIAALMIAIIVYFLIFYWVTH